MSDLIISVSGLRGIVGENLTPEIAGRYVVAYAETLPSGTILVSRDSRPSGEMLTQVIRSWLRAVGRNVIDAAITATPTTGVLVRHHQCAGGIQVSASHNPAEYNGIKLFSSEGRVITAAAGNQVIDEFESGKAQWARHDRVGTELALDDVHQVHLQQLLETINVQRIRQKKFKVLLDSNHGAGSRLGEPLLGELGCDVYLRGPEPNGQFAHPPEPTAENLQSICRQVSSAGADVGFCQDPDADRLAVIDETGRFLGEEYTLALCLDHVLRKHQGPIVTNCSTSRMARDLAQKYGVSFFQSAVGEANVVECMLEHKAVFGGEGNGGPIDPRIGYVRDSFVGMALILDALAERDEKVSQQADQLPRYEIYKSKVSLDRKKMASALDQLESHFDKAETDRMDGLRLDWPDRWLLVRASNTEPILRIIAEATSIDQAKQLVAEATDVIAQT